MSKVKTTTQKPSDKLLTIEQAEAHLNEVQQEVNRLKQRIADIPAAIAFAWNDASRRAELEQEQMNTRARLETLTPEIAPLQRHIADMRRASAYELQVKELSELEQQLDASRSEYEQTRAQVSDLEKQTREAAQTSRQLRSKIHRLEDRIGTLKRQVDSQ